MYRVNSREAPIPIRQHPRRNRNKDHFMLSFVMEPQLQRCPTPPPPPRSVAPVVLLILSPGQQLDFEKKTA